MSTIDWMEYNFRRTPLWAWNAAQGLQERQERLDRMRRMVSSLQRLQRHNKQPDGQQFSNLRINQSTFEEEIDLYCKDDYWQIAALLIVAAYEKNPFAPSFTEGGGGGGEQVQISENADNWLETMMAGTSSAPFVHQLLPSRILRAAVLNPNCPPSLQEYAFLVYYRHLMEPTDDITGRVPLHWAVSQKIPQSASLVLDLLQACPRASRVRDRCSLNGGVLPLGLAVHNPYLSWSRGLSLLVQANPEALVEVPGYEETIVFPQILSLVSNNFQDLFCLVRACPKRFESFSAY